MSALRHSVLTYYFGTAVLEVGQTSLMTIYVSWIRFGRWKQWSDKDARVVDVFFAARGEWKRLVDMLTVILGWMAEFISLVDESLSCW